MNFNYNELLSEMDKRKFGTDSQTRILNEEKELRSDSLARDFNRARQYQWLRESSVIKYIIGAMLPVAQNYTQQIVRCRTSVEHVLSQMNKNIYSGAPLEFRYQGSVSNNTHIRHNSDVDLLTITGNYITLEPPQIATHPYKGNPNYDLRLLRENCVIQIRKAMTNVVIDDSGAKSIALTKGPLIVKVDIVPSNWYDSVRYTETKLEVYRGIQVYDKKKDIRILNYPFLFNELLKQKDSTTGGVFKRAVRLLKSIKADVEKIEGTKINFSSYGISSLLYSVPAHRYHIGESPLTLLRVVNETLAYYGQTENFNKLKDPLGEPLNSNSHSVEGVRKLQSATSLMLNDIGEDINKRISVA